MTGEIMLINSRTFAGADLGDNFWGGLTAAAKFGDVSVDGQFVYGQRTVTCVARTATTPNPGCDNNNTAQEKGWGIIATAGIPIGPINVGLQGWYTSGDGTAGPANTPPCPAYSSSNGCQTGDSDKLPMIADEDSWVGLTYVAGWLFGTGTGIGGPGGGSNYSTYCCDMTGTYGLGGQVTYALTPDFTIGGGVAYVGATDQGGFWGTTSSRSMGASTTG